MELTVRLEYRAPCYLNITARCRRSLENRDDLLNPSDPFMEFIAIDKSGILVRRTTADEPKYRQSRLNQIPTIQIGTKISDLILRKELRVRVYDYNSDTSPDRLSTQQKKLVSKQ